MSDNSRAASPAKKDTVPGTYASAVGNDGTATLPTSRIENVSDVHDYDRQFPALPTSDQRPRTATSRPYRGPMLRTTSPTSTSATTGARQGSLRRRQLNGASAALNVLPANLRPVGNSVVEPLETCQDRVVDSEQTGDHEGDGLAGTPADVFQGAGRPSHPSTITLDVENLSFSVNVASSSGGKVESPNEYGKSAVDSNMNNKAEQISETLSSRGVDVRDSSAAESLLNSSADLLSRAKNFLTQPRSATRLRYSDDSKLDKSLGGGKENSDGLSTAPPNDDALAMLLKDFAQGTVERPIIINLTHFCDHDDEHKNRNKELIKKMFQMENSKDKPNVGSSPALDKRFHVKCIEATKTVSCVRQKPTKSELDPNNNCTQVQSSRVVLKTTFCAEDFRTPTQRGRRLFQERLRHTPSDAEIFFRAKFNPCSSSIKRENLTQWELREVGKRILRDRTNWPMKKLDREYFDQINHDFKTLMSEAIREATEDSCEPQGTQSN
ncbi:unnamed protein product [Caenorhabditis auriculariae]|uniref:Uncharacterized protein n=1 Tax=Caenorhabditis auriculariae TaxID=2777116 RepID=A0A8S1HQ13_9PELO|nr:unnamed protein product [Caenorhabditis auriculariae]